MLECSKMNRSEGWLVFLLLCGIWFELFGYVQVGWFSVADLPMPGFHNAFSNCKCPQRRLGIEHQRGRHNIGPNRRFFLFVFIHELIRFDKVEKKAPSFQPSIRRWPWSCVTHCIPFRGANNSKIPTVHHSALCWRMQSQLDTKHSKSSWKDDETALCGVSACQEPKISAMRWIQTIWYEAV